MDTITFVCAVSKPLRRVNKIYAWPCGGHMPIIYDRVRDSDAVFVLSLPRPPAAAAAHYGPPPTLTRLERCERRASRRRLALGRLDQHPLAHAEHEDLVRTAYAVTASVDVRTLPVLLDAAQERGGRRLLAALLLQPLLAEQPADLGGMRRRLPRCRGAEVQGAQRAQRVQKVQKAQRMQRVQGAQRVQRVQSVQGVQRARRGPAAPRCRGTPRRRASQRARRATPSRLR